MTNKYEKVGNKVLQVTAEINVDKKIAALQDDVTRLNNELKAVQAEIAALENLK